MNTDLKEKKDVDSKRSRNENVYGQLYERKHLDEGKKGLNIRQEQKQAMCMLTKRGKEDSKRREEQEKKVRDGYVH